MTLTFFASRDLAEAVQAEGGPDPAPQEPRTSLRVAPVWRREYNEERPKKGLGGLTPPAYARRLAETESRMTLGL